MSVLSVSLSTTHTFSKPPVPSITLLPGLGVQGDAHLGATVQHRSRLHLQPAPPNLRQIHLIPAELFAETGSGLRPGDLGENITTRGVDLIALGRGTRLRFVSGDGSDRQRDGPTVVVTGLRNPCPQIDRFRAGLKEKMLVRDASRRIVGRLAGVMGVVESGGEIVPGMRIVVERPGEFVPLECV